MSKSLKTVLAETVKLYSTGKDGALSFNDRRVVCIDHIISHPSGMLPFHCTKICIRFMQMGRTSYQVSIRLLNDANVCQVSADNVMEKIYNTWNKGNFSPWDFRNEPNGPLPSHDFLISETDLGAAEVRVYYEG